MSYDGVWGLFPWFAERGAELVHPEDLAQFEKLSPYGKVFHVMGSKDGYLQLRYNDETFRVRPELFEPVTNPAFSFGDPAVVRRHPDQVGEVCGILWHFARKEEMYLLCFGGKASNRRYNRDELFQPRVESP